MAYYYNKYSPYYDTALSPDGTYLDLLVTRDVPAQYDDEQYTIDTKYHHRPDLLAYDLYGSAQLWWVFAERNPNALRDPVGDFRAGLNISLPNKQMLMDSLRR
jgi:Base plate wedge protein 53